MAREIKFRGKRVDNGEWVKGYLINIAYRSWIKDANNKTSLTKLAPNYADIRCVEIDADTIGQYTGLKDKSGVEIYEGDIVKHGYTNVYGDFFHNYIVEYNTNTSCYELRYSDEFKRLTKRLTKDQIKLYKTEVIGNIWDHPELLKGES